MKYAVAASIIFTAFGMAAPAMAQGWITPDNGKASSYVIGSNDVIMKISMPPKEFQMLEQMMKADKKACRMMEIYPGAANTVVITCGG